MSSPMNRIGSDITTQEVWAENLCQEFALIREIVDEYSHIAVDVDFPGVIIQRLGNFNSPADNRYQTIQTNVELLHPIRTTLTFFDDADSMSSPMNRIGSDITTQEVWAENLCQEFALIREIVDEYSHIAVDVDFPGVIIQRLGNFNSPADNRYQTIQTNVELLHPIRTTLTFFDDAGGLPCSPSGGGGGFVWQFNFRGFDVDADIADPDAVEVLRGRGVDFAKHREQGIDARDFGELLMPSGAVLNDSVEWITFDGGYDMAFLLRILTGRRLPETREGFFELVNIFFPTVYDVKHLTAFCDDLDGRLVQVAEQLGVEKVGVCHQAGCDSLVTARVFRKMKEKYFDGAIEKYGGSLHGLNLNNS